MTEPHLWPACPWPGWAQLYAHLIRNLREMDPELVVTDFEGATLSIGEVTSSLPPGDADGVFARIEQAEQLSEIACVVCGTVDPATRGAGWPPLCEEHGV